MIFLHLATLQNSSKTKGYINLPNFLHLENYLQLIEGKIQKSNGFSPIQSHLSHEESILIKTIITQRGRLSLVYILRYSEKSKKKRSKLTM